MELTEPVNAEVTPWQQNHYYRRTCNARTCSYPATFYRYVITGGPEFLQMACAEHAGKEDDFCQHCGHYLDGREVCPKCRRGKEEQVDAD